MLQFAHNTPVVVEYFFVEDFIEIVLNYDGIWLIILPHEFEDVPYVDPEVVDGVAYRSLHNFLLDPIKHLDEFCLDVQ